MTRDRRYRYTRYVTRLAGMLALSSLLGCSRDGDVPAADSTPEAVNVSATPRPTRDSAQVMTVYKSPTCTCCTAWVEHVRRNGFQVVAIDTTDLDEVKRRYGVAPEHAACHTATVGGYVVEGHVPAADIRRLLAERPSVTGLAVPGMPVGSPGMEGAYRHAYAVLAFTRGGPTSVFARH